MYVKYMQEWEDIHIKCLIWKSRHANVCVHTHIHTKAPSHMYVHTLIRAHTHIQMYNWSLLNQPKYFKQKQYLY